jgi:hypothetical protein
MKGKQNTVYLTHLKWISLFIILFMNISFAKEIIIPLKDLSFNNPILRGIDSEYDMKLPIPSRYIVKKIYLHLEIEKSISLVKKRSSLSVFFNDKIVAQKHFDPLVNIMVIDTKIPVKHLEPYNDIKIRAIHHYCVNCCEYDGSPELWSKIDLKKSYVKIKYEEKPILSDTLLIRDYVLDPKLYNPVKFSIMTENLDNTYITMATKLAGYIGNYIKYRKIKINYTKTLPSDKDTFIIGSKDFIAKMLDIRGKIPDIYIYPNPKNLNKAIVVISGDTLKDIEKSLYSFIGLKKNVYTGKYYDINSVKKLDTNVYSSFINIPLGEKIYLKNLGYDDFEFKGVYPPPAIIKFRLPEGLYLNQHKTFTFHLAFNYGAGARKDSVINIYLNSKYVTSLKMDKKYGTVFEEKDINIPVYMLAEGLNEIKVEYAMMAPGGGFCIAPNTNTLRGTIFSSQSYIKVPYMPYWFKMPYLEYFVDTGFPYTFKMFLNDTAFLINEKNNKVLSSLFTLASYIGSKMKAPPFELKVYSNINDDLKSKHIIYIGRNIPMELQQKSPLKITDNIDVSIPIIKKVKNLFYKSDNKILKLNYINSLTKQVFFLMYQSPYNTQKVVTVIYSKNLDGLENAVYRLYEPKFASHIKGDVSIWDFYVKEFFSDNIGNKFYIGNLPFIDKIMFELGFSPVKLVIVTVIIVLLIALILKKLLDYREKRRLEGEI